MIRRIWGVLVGLALLLAACTTPEPAITAPAAPSGAKGLLAPDRIQILHTNDIHGHLESERIGSGAQTFQQGGLALLAGLVRDQRARGPERTLLLDAGDAWQGTFISDADKGQTMVRVMSKMGYDAAVVGNHDFDYGQEVLAQRVKEASYPFLLANVVDATGRAPPYLTPYVVKDLGIAKVALLGLLRTETATTTKATNVAGLRFVSAIETARRLVPELRKQADLVVVVSHLGATPATGRENDASLAEAVPDIDVIVGGHDHVALRTARLVGKTTIVQQGKFAEGLGRLEIQIDPATRRLAHAFRGDEVLPVTNGAAKPDTEVASIIEGRRAAAEQVTKRVVGRTTVPLAASRDPDTPLGNLVADALLAYGRGQGWQSDVAFYNGAGLRASLPAGDITYGALFEVLPFSNLLVNVDFTGSQLKDVFEAASGSAGRLQMSGATWEYRFENPAGRRVLSATVGGAPLDPARVYHVITIDYLLLGGDGHGEFAAGKNVAYGDFEVDAVAAYLTARSPVAPVSDGRVVQR